MKRCLHIVRVRPWLAAGAMESCETRGAMPRVVVSRSGGVNGATFCVYVGRAWCEREDFEEERSSVKRPRF